MPTDLLIDIGHSRIKWACAVDGRLVNETAGQAGVGHFEQLEQIVRRHAPVRRAVLCAQSRRATVEAITARLAQCQVDIDIIASGDRLLPVTPAYPGLGCDRWLALQWPWQQSRGALLVADCGSALTIDLVDTSGRHLGGWIMAGLHAARDGLLARAPGLAGEPCGEFMAGRPARTTAAAVAAGGWLQLAGAIEFACDRAGGMLDDHIDVWITGGDAPGLAGVLRQPAHHDPYLVLRGLAMAARTT